MGALGAALLASALAVLCFCGLGAIERKRWNGQVPSIAEYTLGIRKPARRSSIIQLRAALFGRRTLLGALAGCLVGATLLVLAATR